VARSYFRDDRRSVVHVVPPPRAEASK
jgi:hypothetical protein